MTSAIPEAVAVSAPPGGGRAYLRRDVQGLRAVAVLAVIADHVVGWPHGGFVGVDVFFVISGYLITGLLLREHARTDSISFTGFYARRVRRIMPNALLTLVTTVAATAVLVGGTRLVETVKDAVAAALTVVNWRFATQGTDYFAQGLPPSPVQHFWSLSVEEQFYFVWPWLMLALLAAAARWSAGRSGRVRRGWLLGSAMGVVVAVSFLWALRQTAHEPSFAYFSTLTRIWELGAGALAAIAGVPVARWFVRHPQWWRAVLAWIGIAGILVSLVVVSADGGFPAPWALLPVAATTLVIVAGEGAGVRGPWVLTNGPMNYVGDASYSLYLWHWPVVVLLPTLVAATSPWFVPLALAVATVLALSAYHLVENPVRHLGRPRPDGRRVRAWPPVAAALAIACVVVLTCTGTAQALRSSVAHPDVSSSAQRRACWGAAELARPRACEDVVFAGPVRPAPADAKDDTGGAYDCYAPAGADSRSCILGDPRGDVRVALVGNSHAAAMIPAIAPEAKARGWRLVVFVGNGCALSTDIGGGCIPTGKVMKRALLDDPEPFDLVITTTSRSASGADNLGRIPGMSNMMNKLEKRGTEVVALSDGPIVSQDALACVARIGADLDECAMPYDEAFAVTDPLLLATEQAPEATYLDITDLYCVDGRCPVVIGNVLAYRDTAGHVTFTYSTTMGRFVGARIDEAVSL
ncbi:acyltransferase family protein [Cellulomonas composti]|uniref:Acyltransferase n=1 Tax=Cellulomonas composti TaxID=266130 RepID=A0A511JBY1_9CELL|nr:acyltransferase family protein [Cellulomonas composti]GEL95484.1 acyltransferase [Cellulomonas composti]